MSHHKQVRQSSNLPSSNFLLLSNLAWLLGPLFGRLLGFWLADWLLGCLGFFCFLAVFGFFALLSFAFLAAGFLAFFALGFLAVGFLAAFLAAGFFLVAAFFFGVAFATLLSLKDPEATTPLVCSRAPLVTPVFSAILICLFAAASSPSPLKFARMYLVIFWREDLFLSFKATIADFTISLKGGWAAGLAGALFFTAFLGDGGAGAAAVSAIMTNVILI